MAGFGSVRGSSWASVAGSLLAGWVAFAGAAQAATVPQRIAAVDNSTRVALTNGVSPRAKLATDLGAAAADRKLEMSVRFSMTAAQQKALTQLLADQQNPASAKYHQWLTPEQFGTQFGMATSDLAKVSSWLTSEGFAVTESSRGGMFVRFTGTVAQANRAFATQIERVNVNGEEHIANLTAPTLPSAIANVTAAVTGLHDFTLKPHHVRKMMSLESLNTGSDLQPLYTTGAGVHYLTPGDVYKIYDVNGLLSSSVNGSGITLAVVGQADISLTDVAAFRAAAGLSVNAPTVQVYGADPGTPTAIDVEESTMDVEWAGALAPSASLLFVTAKDVIDGSITEVIDNNLAAVISNSYGECEAEIGVTDLNYYNSLLQQGAAEGITIVSSAGDSGATDCDYGTATATHGFAVDFPASSPYVTGVGGTTFNEGTGTYWSSTNGTGGVSVTGSIPETAWDDSSSGKLQSGGGGASLVFPKPSWQIGSGVPVDASRDVPDVAFSASAIHDPYVLCLSGSCVSGFANSGGGIGVVGGTSVTSPVFAGMMTLVVQKQGRVGTANNTLYALANSSYAANVFRDVTTGSNASPCTTGSTDCASGGTIGYSAGVGYDQATGWGSVDALNLVNDWGLVTALTTTPAGLTASITNLAGSTNSVVVGTSVTLMATVASGVSTVTTAPTGTITFTVDSVVVGSPVAVSSTGVATMTLSTTALSAGTHKLQATYGGDSVYYGSKGAYTLTVTGSTSTAPNFTITPANVSLGASAGGFSQAIAYTVTPKNGFTGTVTFDAIYSTTANITKIFSASSVTISGTSPATTTLTLATYTGGDLAESHVRPFGWEQVGSGVVLAGLLVLFVPSKRRRVPGLLVVLLSTGALVMLGGCAGNGNSNTTTTDAGKTNAATGTYAITVTATSTVSGTAVTHTAAVNLTVQ